LAKKKRAHWARFAFIMEYEELVQKAVLYSEPNQTSSIIHSQFIQDVLAVIVDGAFRQE
jgi:hypothetical protein